MSRPFLAAITCTAAVAASVAAALAPGAVSAKGGPAKVSVAVCHPSAVVAERSATFTGQMRAISGTKRMAMHFTLLEKLSSSSNSGASGFKPVSLPDLKPWRRSKSGAHMFIYTQKVTALRDGGSYRMRVQYRWYGANKTLLRSSTLHSRTCRQPSPLPDVAITSIAAAPAATSDQRMYSITVFNNGFGDAQNVPVVLKVDGTVVGSSTVDLLPAQESSVVQIPGPPCAFTVRAVANPKRLLRETDQSNDALTVPCAQANS